jgi:hypothetical protein
MSVTQMPALFIEQFVEERINNDQLREGWSFPI